jgi:hypothetical protein
MDTPEKKQVFSLTILGLSFIAIILLLTTDFGGFWLTGYYTGERYSCLFCEYGSFFDKIIIVLLIILLAGQGAIALNSVLPKKFLQQKLEILGMISAGATVFLTIVGGIAIAIEFGDYWEWWLGTAFYTGLIAGIVNFGLYFLLHKNRVSE